MVTLFKGNNGKWSMMRVLCFLVITLGFAFIFMNPEQAGAMVPLMISGVAGKWLQKKGEGDG